MSDALLGRKIILEPLPGDSDVKENLAGVIVEMVSRPGFKRTWVYYLVKLTPPVRYRHPSWPTSSELPFLLVQPDGTQLEWAFFGGGPPGLPVLVKVFGVMPEPGSRVTDYVTGETFLLARAVARENR